MLAVLTGNAPACRAEAYETEESLEVVKCAEQVRKAQLVSGSPLGMAPGCDVTALLTGSPSQTLKKIPGVRCVLSMVSDSFSEKDA